MKVPVALNRLVALVERGGSQREPDAADMPAEPEPEGVAAPDAEPEPEAGAPSGGPVLTLAATPPLEAQPEPEAGPEPVVVPLVLRDSTPRAWNLWELERLAAKLEGGSPGEERRLLLLHLRQFAGASGDLPVEFDPLIRDAFGSGLAELAR